MIVVVREPWRFDPLAWIHRAEARGIAREMRSPLVEYSNALGDGVLLRVSDPFMRRAVAEMRVRYFGPGRDALERCYDKYEATRTVAAAGIDVPETFLGDSATLPRSPFVVKPRRGSDSLGVRIASVVPASKRNAGHLVQERIFGREVTVGIFRDEVGLPLRILVPPGKPYSFSRKYVLRPARSVLVDEGVREAARLVARTLGVDWAARVDFIVEEGSGRAHFLECDAAPLVGADSAFAASFSAAGIDRHRQLEWLTS
jgi:D-alanine-D-alanine ligase-like ATP-grasp enzyme